MINWLRENVFKKTKSKYRAYYIHKSKQHYIYVDIYDYTPAKARKQAKEHAKYFINKKYYKFVKVDKL